MMRRRWPAGSSRLRGTSHRCCPVVGRVSVSACTSSSCAPHRAPRLTVTSTVNPRPTAGDPVDLRQTV
eukprot:2552211-Pyramimonas_sp.AAC.1